jgi:hypothetical protein
LRLPKPIDRLTFLKLRGDLEGILTESDKTGSNQIGTLKAGGGSSLALRSFRILLGIDKRIKEINI